MPKISELPELNQQISNGDRIAVVHDGETHQWDGYDYLVKNSGNETIAGVKTFSSSPVVPAPTADMEAATKKYVDDYREPGAVHTTGDETVAGTKTFSSSPLVPSPAITDDSTKAATTAFVKDSIMAVSDSARLLDITGDGVPYFPDGAFVYFKNKDWASVTGWNAVNAGNTLSIENASLKIVTAAGNQSGVFSSNANFQNKLVRIIIKSDTPITSITTTIGTTLTPLNLIAIGGGRYMADIYWYRTGSDSLAFVVNYPATAAITWYLESIYIGTGAYTTPLFSRSCCNQLTNYGLIPVRSPFGLALRASGAQYAEADNPVIGSTGTIAVYFKRGLLGTAQTIVDNRDNTFLNGIAIALDASNTLSVIIRDATLVPPYAVATIADTTTYHSLVVIWDGSTIKTYLDGVYSTRAQVAPMSMPTKNLRICSHASSATNYFTGDLIARYDARVWSAAEVASWHNNPRSVDSQQKSTTNTPYAITTRDSKGNLRQPGLPVYADNAAATTGGLVVGEQYRTSTGVLMVVY